jgi:tripartite-type tricarboxylate transporter receptor subunit TctC
MIAGSSWVSKILGQSIIIENVSGAGGTVGSARVAAAAPDGYTLLVSSHCCNALTIAPLILICPAPCAQTIQ